MKTVEWVVPQKAVEFSWSTAHPAIEATALKGGSDACVLFSHRGNSSLRRILRGRQYSEIHDVMQNTPVDNTS